MALEKTGEIVEASASGYDQVNASNSSQTQTSKGSSSTKGSGRTDKNFQSAQETVINSSEGVSIGFVISFSVPLDAAGIFPTKGNC